MLFRSVSWLMTAYGRQESRRRQRRYPRSPEVVVTARTEERLVGKDSRDRGARDEGKKAQDEEEKEEERVKEKGA